MHRIKFWAFFVVFVAGLIAAPFLRTQSASAVTGSQWQAGRIIDDTVFTDNASMSVTDVQNFLNQKVGTTQANGTPGVCDTNGIQQSELGGGTRAQYGAAHGNPAPFTCLRDYYEVPKTTPGAGTPANNYGGAAIPAGAQSAAQIIWGAAQKYGISPKVLLVMIQKESVGPLTTDDWPFRSQYTYAMGANCPDGPNGAQCDSNYAGFSIQIYESARLLRYYLDNMTQPWWNYNGNPSYPNCGYGYGCGYPTPYQTNYILWNTTYTNCGGSNIYISNKATAALYTYTPYQPNQAALNNLYGTGDGCSAYGNRNFWRIFSDWFGTTYAPDYSYQVLSQYAYTDSTKTNAVGLNNLLPGQTVYVGVVVKNMGNQTWSNSGPHPVDLGTSTPLDRASPFCSTGWLGCNRPTRMKEASVAPGQTGTFEFNFTAPYTTQGSFQEHFDLVAEGVAWMPNIGLYFNVTVQPPQFSWNLGSQYAYTDSTKTTPTGLGGLAPGQVVYIGFTAVNTGNVTWLNSGPNAVDAGTSNPYDRASPFCSTGWLGCNRPTRMKEASVAPGQTGTFEFNFTAPYALQGGNFMEYVNLVSEGRSWFTNFNMNFSGSTITPNYSWQSMNQYAYTDSTKTTPTGLGNLTPGQTVYVGLTVKNTGNVTWTNTGLHAVDLGTSNPYDRASPFCSTGWLGCNRPTRMKEASVAPGQTGTFEFNFTAPSTRGTYYEYFDPVVEGFTWMPNIGLNYQVKVN